MSNDLFKTVLYNDGEGITHGDLNDSQRFIQAQLFDSILQGLVGAPGNAETSQLEGTNASGNVPTLWAYCPAIGGAQPIQGSANNKVKISAGTLYQKIGSSTGSTPTFIPFTFDGTLEFSIANGSAINPRVDMIQMKLEYEDGDPQTRDFEDGTTHVVTSNSMNKQNRIKATFSVKSGTVAASPVYPTPDAGYVPIACVVVGTNYAAAAGLKLVDTAGAVAVLHDLRMPFKIRPQTLNAANLLFSPSNWAPSTAGTFDLVGSGTVGGSYLAAPCPETKCRLVGVGAAMHQGSAIAIYLTQLNTASPTETNVDDVRLFDLGAISVPVGGPGADTNTMVDLCSGATTPLFAAGPTVVGTASYDLPVWGNGKRAYSSQSNTSVADRACAVFGVVSGIVIRSVTFYVATGL